MSVTEIRRIILSTTFIISYVTLFVTITVGYWLITEERPDERFISLSTLGKNDTKNGYYLSNNNRITTVLPGQKVSWHIHVYNHAGSAEYVSVKIKLLNSTDSAPNENYSSELRSHYVHEFRHLLARNSSWDFPLNWKISNVSTDPIHRYVCVLHICHTETAVTVKGLDINNHHVDGLKVISLEGKLRMIIELWKYNMDDKAFVFQGFPENDNNRGSWNQIWFNLKV